MSRRATTAIGTRGDLMSEFKLEHGKRYVTRNGTPTLGVVIDCGAAGVTDDTRFLCSFNCDYIWLREDGTRANGELVLVAEYVRPPEPKWVPFDECDAVGLIGRVIRRKDEQPHVGKMIVSAGDNGVAAIHTMDEDGSDGLGIELISLDELFAQNIFADGTPCGKQVQ